MKKYKEEVKVKAVKEEIGEEQYTLLKQLKNLRNLIAVPQARLPFEFSIQ
jgi:protease-4